MKRGAIALTAGALALGVIAGCGDDDDDDGGGGNGGGSAATTVDISGTDFKFDPANPSVDHTGQVRFRLTNDGESPHALEVEGPDGEAETEEISPGQSATLDIELSEPGEYTMYCPVGNHREMGMEGKVIVGGGGSGSGGGDSDDDGGDSDAGRGY